MLKNAFTAILCGLILTGCCGVCKTVCSANKKYTIVAFGDSITKASIGIYPDGKPWTTLLGEKLGDKYNVINAGFNGNSAREAMARCQKDVISCNPDLVLLEFGGNNNDPFNKARQVSLEELKKHLADFKAMLPAKTKVVVVTFPPVIDEKHWIHTQLPDLKLDEALEVYRNTTREFAAANGYPVFDLYKIIYPDRYKLILDDGVHLNQAGQVVFAEKMFELLQKEGICK